jgi:hypothetical protein
MGSGVSCHHRHHRRRLACRSTAGPFISDLQFHCSNPICRAKLRGLPTDIHYDQATGRILFVGTTGTVAVFKELDPDHYELLGKVPTGAIAKTGLWVPELKRFYSAVARHYVVTVRHGRPQGRPA